METSWKKTTLLVTLGFLFTGCATTSRFKPEGLTEQQISETLERHRQMVGHILMGTPLKLTFYPGAVDIDGTALSGEVTGFFYAFNKLNDTLSISKDPLTLVDRGTPYYLNYISEITSMVPMTTTENPAEAPQLSKIGFRQTPDFQRELLTQ